MTTEAAASGRLTTRCWPRRFAVDVLPASLVTAAGVAMTFIPSWASDLLRSGRPADAAVDEPFEAVQPVGVGTVVGGAPDRRATPTIHLEKREPS